MSRGQHNILPSLLVAADVLEEEGDSVSADFLRRIVSSAEHRSHNMQDPLREPITQMGTHWIIHSAIEAAASLSNEMEGLSIDSVKELVRVLSDITEERELDGYGTMVMIDHPREATIEVVPAEEQGYWVSGRIWISAMTAAEEGFVGPFFRFNNENTAMYNLSYDQISELNLILERRLSGIGIDVDDNDPSLIATIRSEADSVLEDYLEYLDSTHTGPNS